MCLRGVLHDDNNMLYSTGKPIPIVRMGQEARFCHPRPVPSRAILEGYTHTEARLESVCLFISRSVPK